MLLQVTLRIFLLSLILTNVHSKQFQPNFCAECEDEVWEEIPCEAIYSSSSTVSPPLYTSPTYSPTSTPMPPTSTSSTSTSSTSTSSTSTDNNTPPSSSSTPPTPITFAPRTSTSTDTTPIPPIESSEGYKKCYCECKSGCREFCRKVVLYPDTSKQILQLSKTNEPQVNGYVEIKHTHERNFVQSSPTYKPNVVQPNPYYQTQQPQKPYQQQPPNPSGSSQYAYNGNSFVLSSGHGYSNIVPGINQINYPLSIQPLLPIHPSYDRPSYKPQNAAQSSYSEQSYSNAVPKSSAINYPSNYNAQLPIYPTPPPYQTPDNTVHAQTAVSGNGNAAAIAISPNAYKSSCSSNPTQGYVGSPRAPNSPSAVRYSEASLALNSLQSLEPSIDNYLREFLYGDTPKVQGYRHPHYNK